MKRQVLQGRWSRSGRHIACASDNNRTRNLAKSHNTTRTYRSLALALFVCKPVVVFVQVPIAVNLLTSPRGICVFARFEMFNQRSGDIKIWLVSWRKLIFVVKQQDQPACKFRMSSFSGHFSAQLSTATAALGGIKAAAHFYDMD